MRTGASLGLAVLGVRSLRPKANRLLAQAHSRNNSDVTFMNGTSIESAQTFIDVEIIDFASTLVLFRGHNSNITPIEDNPCLYNETFSTIRIELRASISSILGSFQASKVFSTTFVLSREMP